MKLVKLGDLLIVFFLVAGAALGLPTELLDLPVKFPHKRVTLRRAVIALDQSLHFRVVLIASTEQILALFVLASFQNEDTSESSSGDGEETGHVCK